MQGVRLERTGWRDQRLSERHRAWGIDCPAADIDFLLLEYDRGLPVALVEYKHEQKGYFTQAHPTFHAIKELADRAGIPFFIARYSADISSFHLLSGNLLAETYIPYGEETMTEAEYVRFLYKLRGYDCPQSIIDGLKVAV